MARSRCAAFSRKHTWFTSEPSEARRNAYLASMRLGDREIPDHRLNGAGDTGPLSLIASTDTSQVDGVVETETGPAARVRVTLIPDQTLPFWPDLFNMVETDASGRFSFTDVVPGAYRLYAWTDVEIGAYQDPEYRKPFEEYAVAMTLAPKGAASVKLKAIQ